MKVNKVKLYFAQYQYVLMPPIGPIIGRAGYCSFTTRKSAFVYLTNELHVILLVCLDGIIVVKKGLVRLQKISDAASAVFITLQN